MKNFINWGLKVRKDKSRNYYSVWENLETVRLDLGRRILWLILRRSGRMVLCLIILEKPGGC